jgi:flagellar motor switch protein FliN
VRVDGETVPLRAALPVGHAGGPDIAGALQDWLTGTVGVLADLLGDVELLQDAGPSLPVAEGTPVLEFRTGDGGPAWLWLPGSLLEAVLPAVGAAGSATAGERRPAVFPSLELEAASGESDPEALLDVPLVVSVELGRTERQIRDILTLVPGSVLELDRLAGDPLDVLVNGRKVARAEVLVVDEQFAIRITEVLSPSERMEQLG